MSERYDDDVEIKFKDNTTTAFHNPDWDIIENVLQINLDYSKAFDWYRDSYYYPLDTIRYIHVIRSVKKK